MIIFAVENIKYNDMCTISIEIDEKALRKANPSLDSQAAITRWVKQVIDIYANEIAEDDEETVDLETARAVLLATVREEYAKP